MKALINHTLGRSDVTGGYIQMSPSRLREAAQRVCDRLMELVGLTPPAATAENITRLA